MYDRQTQSWWQQFGGAALVGHYTGTKLEQLPSRIVAWADFRQEHPNGKVLSRDTGYSRPYGQNPYPGYDDVDSPPFFPTRNSGDDRLPPKERVVYVERGGEAVVVPFSALKARRELTVEVGGDELTVRWRPGTASALDQAPSPRVATLGRPKCSWMVGSSPSISRSGSRSPPSGPTHESSAEPSVAASSSRSGCARLFPV
jgi:hypothetical protein